MDKPVLMEFLDQTCSQNREIKKLCHDEGVRVMNLLFLLRLYLLCRLQPLQVTR